MNKNEKGGCFMRLSLNPKKYEGRVLSYLEGLESNRSYIELLELEIIDDESYRALVKFIDHFEGVPFEDTGVYYIPKDVL